MANPDHVELVKKGAEAIGAWREQNPDVQLDVVGSDLGSADLLKADLSHANLSEASLSGANLSRADLSGADLTSAILSEAFFIEARLNKTSFNLVRAARSAKFLARVVVEDGPSLHFETCERAWFERWLDWERIRTLGRLPLFTASYLVLLAIPVFIFLLAHYNNHLIPLLEWAKVVAEQPDQDFHELGIQIKEHLRSIAPPSQMAWAWVASVFLALATTLYHLRCPSRVKEFSRDQWCDEHKNDLIHYWPLSWKERPTRLICVISYIIGGTLALWIFGTKAWRALHYIIENTPNPWSLL